MLQILIEFLIGELRLKGRLRPLRMDITRLKKAELRLSVLNIEER